MGSPIPKDELDTIKGIWQSAVTTTTNQNVQAQFRGRNYRLNIFLAFKTAYHVTKAVVKAKAAAVLGTITPWEAFEIAESTYSALSDGLNAVSEDMRPLVYVASIVLGSEDSGMTAKELEEKLRTFIPEAQAGGSALPWYLLLSAAKLKQAADDLASLDPFTDLIDELREGDWVGEADGKLTFKPRHIVWGFTRV